MTKNLNDVRYASPNNGRNIGKKPGEPGKNFKTLG